MDAISAAADGGGGLALGPAELRALTVAGSSVGAFALAFAAIALSCRTELSRVRACVALARAALLCLVGLDALQLYCDVAYAQRVTAPSLGVVRPVAGLLSALLGFGLDSHAVFRWAALLTSPVLAVLDVTAAAALRWQADCRAAGLCVPEPAGGFPTAVLLVLEGRDYAAAALEVRACVDGVVGVGGDAGGVAAAVWATWHLFSLVRFLSPPPHCRRGWRCWPRTASLPSACGRRGSHWRRWRQGTGRRRRRRTRHSCCARRAAAAAGAAARAHPRAAAPPA